MAHLQVVPLERNGGAIELGAGLVIRVHQIVFVATGFIEGEAFSRAVAEKQHGAKADHQAADIQQIDGGQGKLSFGLQGEFIERHGKHGAAEQQFDTGEAGELALHYFRRDKIEVLQMPSLLRDKDPAHIDIYLDLSRFAIDQPRFFPVVGQHGNQHRIEHHGEAAIDRQRIVSAGYQPN